MVLRHCTTRRSRSITRGEAFALYGIANLWQRVRELEARGHEFKRHPRVKVRGGVFVTRYTLKHPGRKH